MLVVQFLGRAAWQGMEARRDIAENLAIRMPMLAAVLDVVLDDGLQARRRILEKDLDFMMARYSLLRSMPPKCCLPICWEACNHAVEEGMGAAIARIMERLVLASTRICILAACCIVGRHNTKLFQSH